MNKLCVTRQGFKFFQEEGDNNRGVGMESTFNRTKRSSSLPHLISTANLAERQEIKTQLGKMTLQIKYLKLKGLRRMLIEKQDKDMKAILEAQYSDRKDYLRSIVPALVKKTRDGHSFGNLNSRVERGRAYLQQLDHNFTHKFIFRPPIKPTLQ